MLSFDYGQLWEIVSSKGREFVVRVSLDIIRVGIRRFVDVVLLLDLSLWYFEPHNTAIPSFNPNNRDLVVMHIDESSFYNQKVAVDSLDVSNVYVIARMD